MADEAVTTSTEEKKTGGFFTGPNGGKSMRRLGAFILIWASIGGSITGAALRLGWPEILVLSAVPLAGAVLLLFFTTWDDVQKVIQAAKGAKND